MQWLQDPASFAVDTNANERLLDRNRRFRQLRSVAFGLKPAPAWASAVSAEAKRILQSFGISVAGVYIDDFLIRAPQRSSVSEIWRPRSLWAFHLTTKLRVRAPRSKALSFWACMCGQAIAVCR